VLFLQQRGYHVDAISNGDDALALLRTNPYDLVLLDEQMPGRRGSRCSSRCAAPTCTRAWSW
jgi:DNA-binding response OmpR family regulator